MNIDDVKPITDLHPDDVLPRIFARQLSLMERYNPIETSNGFPVPDYHGLGINNSLVQARIKDHFWRATEEIGEAFEEVLWPSMDVMLLTSWKRRWLESYKIRHFFEELADALHFIVEATLICQHAGVKIDANQILVELPWFKHTNLRESTDAIIPECIGNRAFELIVGMGLAANTLKNKPWKVTQMVTDVDRLRTKLMHVWRCVALLWQQLNADCIDMAQLYFRKATVNQFRQETKY